MKVERGLALQDLITGAYEYVETIELKPHARVYLLDYLATTECACLCTYPLPSPLIQTSLDIVFLVEPMKKSS